MRWSIVASNGGPRHERSARGAVSQQATEGLCHGRHRRASCSGSSSSGCATCSCRAACPACRSRRRRWRGCSICAAASSRRSISGAGSGFAPRDDGATPIAVGIEEKGELYGVIVDRVGDVLWLKRSTYEANPVNLDPRWARVCAGVHRLEHGLMVVLDVDKVLDLTQLAWLLDRRHPRRPRGGRNA